MSFGQKVFDEMIWDQDMHVRKGTSVKYLKSFILIGKKNLCAAVEWNSTL